MAYQINSVSIRFRCRSKKTSKLRVTGICEWNSPVTCEFPAQSVSNTENVSIRWRHYEMSQGYQTQLWILNRNWYDHNNINHIWGHVCQKQVSFIHWLLKYHNYWRLLLSHKSPYVFGQREGVQSGHVIMILFVGLSVTSAPDRYVISDGSSRISYQEETCGLKLINIHSHVSTAQPLNFGNR